MVRTTFDLDPELLENTQRYSGAPTKKAAIEEAMREYVNIRRRERLMARLGKGTVTLTPEELKEMRRPRQFDEAD